MVKVLNSQKIDSETIISVALGNLIKFRINNVERQNGKYNFDGSSPVLWGESNNNIRAVEAQETNFFLIIIVLVSLFSSLVRLNIRYLCIYFVIYVFYLLCMFVCLYVCISGELARSRKFYFIEK
jgi:hypothetical protein